MGHRPVVCFPPSVVELCQVFQQREEPSEALTMLQRVKMVAVRLLIVLAGEQERLGIRVSLAVRVACGAHLPGVCLEQFS